MHAECPCFHFGLFSPVYARINAVRINSSWEQHYAVSHLLFWASTEHFPAFSFKVCSRLTALTHSLSLFLPLFLSLSLWLHYLCACLKPLYFSNGSQFWNLLAVWNQDVFQKVPLKWRNDLPWLALIALSAKSKSGNNSVLRCWWQMNQQKLKKGTDRHKNRLCVCERLGQEQLVWLIVKSRFFVHNSPKHCRWCYNFINQSRRKTARKNRRTAQRDAAGGKEALTSLSDTKPPSWGLHCPGGSVMNRFFVYLSMTPSVSAEELGWRPTAGLSIKMRRRSKRQYYPQRCICSGALAATAIMRREAGFGSLECDGGWAGAEGTEVEWGGALEEEGVGLWSLSATGSLLLLTQENSCMCKAVAVMRLSRNANMVAREFGTSWTQTRPGFDVLRSQFKAPQPSDPCLWRFEIG